MTSQPFEDRSIIGVDWDSTLVEFMPPFLEWLKLNKGKECDVNQYTDYKMSVSYGGTDQEWFELIKEFWDYQISSWNSDNGAPKIIPDSKEVLRRLKQSNNLIIITARPASHHDYIKDVSDYLFPGTFKEVLAVHRQNKAEVLTQKGASALIDDKPSTAMVTASYPNIKSIFFKRYKLDIDHKDSASSRVITVANWKEVEAVL